MLCELTLLDFLDVRSESKLGNSEWCQTIAYAINSLTFVRKMRTEFLIPFSTRFSYIADAAWTLLWISRGTSPEKDIAHVIFIMAAHLT